MSSEMVVRLCGRWKRIRPGRSFSEHAFRQFLSMCVGLLSHSPRAALAAQLSSLSIRASQRSALAHSTFSVWLAQMRWMWHEARHIVVALCTSVSHPPCSGKVDARVRGVLQDALVLLGELLAGVLALLQHAG